MRALPALALVVALAACGDKSTNEPLLTTNIAGTWSLTSINGVPLPYTITNAGGSKIELTGDVFTVATGGRFTQVTSIRTTTNGTSSTQNTPASGPYSISGNAITFIFDSDGMTGTAALSGATMTVTGNGIVAVYGKQ